MPPSATAARRLLNPRLAIQEQGATGMLRDGEGAAAGDEGHEKGSAVLGKQLAPADVVVAVLVWMSLTSNGVSDPILARLLVDQSSSVVSKTKGHGG